MSQERGRNLARALGREVRALRVARGLTLTELAAAAGVDRAWLCRLEQGAGGDRGPGLISIEKVLVPLGRRVSVERLITRAG